jgi:transglutaminase-like putative cysteine protease
MRRPALVTGVLLLAALSLLVPLAPLVQGHTWAWWYAGMAGGVLALTAGFRAMGLKPGAADWLGLAAVPLTVLAVFVLGRGDPGSRFHQLGDQMVRTVVLESPPVAPRDGVLVVAALGGGLIAASFDWYAFTVKAPAVAGVFMCLVLALAVTFVRQGVDLWRLAVPALAFLAVLAVAPPGMAVATGLRPRTGVALWLGALSIIGALLAAQFAPRLLPDLDSSGLFRPGKGGITFAGGVNPLLELGEDLRSPGTGEVIRYTTSLEQGFYLRLTTLAMFDGSNWSHVPNSPMVEAGQLWANPAAQANTAQPVLQARITVNNLSADWVPLPWVSQNIEAGGGYQVEVNDLTVKPVGWRIANSTYRVTFAQPDAAAQNPVELMSAEQLRPYLALPAEMPPLIGQTALAVTAAQPTPLARAQALQDYFLSGDFAYSTSAPVDQGFDGDSAAVVARFLEVKEGYCVHFAAAMALMAREVGLPSRIALGYLPGTRVSWDGKEATFSVRANQLHSWPEVFVEGVGWLAFEPTVSRYGEAGGQPTATAAEEVPTEAAAPTAQPTAAASDEPSEEAAPESGTGVAAARSQAPWPVPLAALAVFLAPAGLRVAQRWARRRHGLAGQWAELRAYAHDLGLGLDDAETPQSFADRLGLGWPEPDRAALEALTHDVEHAAYAATPATHVVASARPAPRVRTIRRAMAAHVPPGRRLFATLWPRSLWTHPLAPVPRIPVAPSGAGAAPP